MRVKKHILIIIVFSQFCCTSLWFAGNGVMADLIRTFNLDVTALGHLTSAVQFGFIVGTLIFALFTIADRFSPSIVFLISALIAAFFNLVVVWEGNSFLTLLLLRFLTGFFLAGIYPIGMKIAADYYDKGLGTSLAYLVGALVVGTAFPHLLKGIGGHYNWKYVLYGTSTLSIIGGTMMFAFVKNGPFRKSSSGLDLSAFFRVFNNRNFRSAAFGYFGHMWELYAFWAFIPLIIASYQKLHPSNDFDVNLISFGAIAIGGIACIIAAYISKNYGTKRTASMALLLSGFCCLLFPVMYYLSSPLLFFGFLFLWGMFVIADSPLFSTLVAQNAESEIKGTALTIVNSIGFAITVISIQLINSLQEITSSVNIYIILAIGPIFGLYHLYRKKRAEKI